MKLAEQETILRFSADEDMSASSPHTRRRSGSWNASAISRGRSARKAASKSVGNTGCRSASFGGE